MCGTAVMTVLTDALPAVWYGDADMGVFSTVRHQVICLLMATRSASLFARTRITDKQGDYSLCAVFSMFLVIANIFIVFSGPRASAAALLCPAVLHKYTVRICVFQSDSCHDCVAGVGVLLCTMRLSIFLLCLRTLLL